MAKFNADYYRQYRPFYPAATFDGIEALLLSRGFRRPFSVADIGCGTGHSSISLLQSGIHAHVIGIDPDSKMLESAQRLANLYQMNDIIFRIGSGESTGIQSSTMDTVLIGSAFHWMHPQQCRDEMIRILKPKGVLRIFEYQFPKAQELPELNEWIRRQFNLNWKADNQKPRGSFFQITDVFRTDARFTPISSRKPPMMINLTADDLAGLIFSQSRVLCYEGKLSDTEKVKFREEVRHVLNLFLQERAVTFDFNLSWFEFGLTCDS